jgi:hypothetical protein
LAKIFLLLLITTINCLSYESKKSENFWAFQPVKETKYKTIDDIINKKLIDKKLIKSKQSDEYTIIRRIYYDLIGLPPSIEEIKEYINSKEENKYEKLVENLLSRKEFGEKWATHWFDIARYADSTGKDQNITYPYAWKYRDYVISSINKDKPYNKFIIEQIAGDLLNYNSKLEYEEQNIATGFLAIGTKSVNQNIKEYNANNIDEQIDITTRGFLGLTLACSRCHDHKSDNFSQKDYYSIYGVFANSQILDGVIRGNNNVGYQGKFAYIDKSENNLYEENCWDEIQEYKNLLMKIYELDNYNKKPNENDLKLIEKEKEKTMEELHKLKYLEEIFDLDNILKNIEPIMSMSDKNKFSEIKIHIRGNVNDLGEIAERKIPDMFSDKFSYKLNNTFSSGRLEFSNWIADKKNPLTYRVYVNRIWNVLFGKGIVNSYDNFGLMSEEPSNIELIDYLNNKFIKYNFSTKLLIKEIVQSESYKRSSQYVNKSYEIDPDNRFFWRMNKKRLNAELIRDSILYVNEILDKNSKDHKELLTNDRKRAVRKDLDSEIKNAKYRSVYLPTLRDNDIDILKTFDKPDNNLLIAKRSVTTVPTQSLFFMNNEWFMEICKKGSEQLIKEKEIDDIFLNDIYLKVFSRNIKDNELKVFKNYIISNSNIKNEDLLSYILKTLMSTEEFINIK